jgi:hypothetical protein
MIFDAENRFSDNQTSASGASTNIVYVGGAAGDGEPVHVGIAITSVTGIDDTLTVAVEESPVADFGSGVATVATFNKDVTVGEPASLSFQLPLGLEQPYIRLNYTPGTAVVDIDAGIVAAAQS